MFGGRLYLIPAALAVMAIGFAIVLAGCWQKEADISCPSPPSTRGQNVAATGPAISEKLTFDQLALDSAVKRVQGAEDEPVPAVRLHR